MFHIYVYFMLKHYPNGTAAAIWSINLYEVSTITMNFENLTSILKNQGVFVKHYSMQQSPKRYF